MRKLLIALLFTCLLVSCSKAETKEVSVNVDVKTPEVTTKVEVNANVEVSTNVEVKTNLEDNDAPSRIPEEEDDGEYVVVCGVKVKWNGYTVVEPDSKLDIDNMNFSDFGDFFKEEYPVERDTYTIMEGAITQTTVTHIHSPNPGPCVYIVGAVHGDEKAAVYAGRLMTKATISCGDLYVLSPANKNGFEHNTRYVTKNQDLNRSFPGDPAGNEAEKLADAIFSDIQSKKPNLMLDLHEAIVYTEGRDFLGSTYIFTELDGMDDLFFSLLFATQDGTICHNEFGYNGPGPAGSVNAEVTRGLRVPSITVETFRGFDIYRRVQDQLDTIQFILDYLEMR